MHTYIGGIVQINFGEIALKFEFPTETMLLLQHVCALTTMR